MKPALLFFLLVFAAFATSGQIRPEIVTGITVNSHPQTGYTSKTIWPFVAGLNVKHSLTRKIYSPTEVHVVSGARYVRTGMGSEGSIPDGGDFYEDNGANYLVDDEGNTIRLEQGFVNIPVGFEFKLRTVPARGRPLDYFSLTVLFNNSLALTSQLTETLAMDDGSSLSQRVDLLPYIGKYHPGVTAEARILKFFMVGYFYQEISFKPARDAINFDGQFPSPFYEFITKDGFYRDINWYVGLVLPVGKSKRKP